MVIGHTSRIKITLKSHGCYRFSPKILINLLHFLHQIFIIQLCHSRRVIIMHENLTEFPKIFIHSRPCCFLRDERNVLNLRNQIFEKVATLKKVKLNSCADFLQASHDSFVLKRSKLQISVKVTLEGCFPGQGSIHCSTYKLTKMGPGTSLYHCQDFISCFSL